MSGYLYLTRHGETRWNRQGRLQGRLGSPLTSRGHAQGRAAARFMAHLGVGRVVASPLPRARNTGQMIATAASCPLETLDSLQEVDFGLCGGLTLPEIQTRFPGLLLARDRDRWHHPWPQGESYAIASDRVQNGLGDPAALLGSNTVFVAHRSINRVIASMLTDLPRTELLDSDQPADVVLRIDAQGSLCHARVPRHETPEAPLWEPGPFNPPKRLAPTPPR